MKKNSVFKTEFWTDSGHHVIWDREGGCYTIYKHAHESRTVRTKRLPIIKNILWLVTNYPLKSLE